MDTHNPGINSWRRYLPPLVALIFSGLFLTTWLTAVSAQYIEQEKVGLSSGSAAGIIPANGPADDQGSIQEDRVSVPLALFELGISKSKSPQTFTVGTNNYYIISIQRLNTETVNSTFGIQDNLPSGMTWTPQTIVGKWNCSASTTTVVSCFYTENIPQGTATIEPIQINVNVASNIASDLVTNTAYLFVGDESTPTAESSVVTPIRSADLAIKKRQAPIPVSSTNTPITYTLVITNNGPTLARSVLITETLPAELDGITVTRITLNGNPQPIPDPHAISFSFASMQRGDIIAITLTSRPKSDASGKQVINTARVSSATHDWNMANNVSGTSFVVGGLEILKSVSDDNVLAGETFYYTLTITNTSQLANSIGALVRDTLTDTLDSTSCTIRYKSTLSNQYVGSSSTCFISSQQLNSYVSIPRDQKALIILGVRGNQGIGEQPRVITNTASVTWGTPSFTLESNEVETVISPAGFIQVTKTDGLSTVFPGESVSYTISITNVGSLALAPGSIRVTDTLYSNLTFVSINKNGHTMNALVQSGNVYAWVFPTRSLGAGEKISFSIGAKVVSSPVGVETINLVEASGTDLPGRPSRSNAEDRTTITTSPNSLLSMVKTVSPIQAQVGETFTFQIVLRNIGTDTASSIIVNDYFPVAVDLTSASTSRGTAQLNTTTREVEIRIPTMYPSEKTTIVITARVNSSVTVAKTYRNRAYVKWTGSGPEIETSPVSYRVLPSGTLPGTGGGVSSAAISGSALIGMGLGGLFLLLGLALLVYSLWAARNKPLSAGRYARIGAIFCGLALLFAIATFLLFPANEKTAELSMLAGDKPPIATSLPILPASTIPPTKTAVKAPTETAFEDGEETVELLPLRPTPDANQPAVDPALPTPTLTNGEIDISHLLPTATPSNLPDFTIPTPTALPSVGPDGGEPDSSAVKRLVIPAMALDTVVKYVPFSGSTWLISGLKQEIAWMGDTSWPGLGSNTGLAGHVDLVTGERGPFWNLKDLKTGDLIHVYTEKKIYTYRVKDQNTVNDTDIGVIQPSDNPQLTLITCTGWDPNLQTYLKRLVVFAELVQVKAITASLN